MTQKNQKERTKEAGYQLDTVEIALGPATSFSLLNDPRHMSFVLARYKFCAKMLEGKREILEIGCGDAFGTPIVAQVAERLVAIEMDVEDKHLPSDRRRLNAIKNIEFRKHDIAEAPLLDRFGGVFSVDVLEHLDAEVEAAFMRNSVACMEEDGVCIVGTPNVTAAQYASTQSAIQHINLKSHSSLRDLMRRYFKNVFMFCMNDEVLHTGYGPMGHYLFAIGVGKK